MLSATPVEQTPGDIGAIARALKHIGINVKKSVSPREGDDLGAAFAASVVRWWLLAGRLKSRPQPTRLTSVPTLGHVKPIADAQRKEEANAQND